MFSRLTALTKTKLFVTARACLAQEEIALGILLLIAIALRIPLWLGGNGVIWPDTTGYVTEAKEILRRHDLLSHALYHTPGYPLFLALFLSFGKLSAVGGLIILAQQLCGVLTVVFSYKAARIAFGPFTAFFAAILLAVHPLLAYYEFVLQTEVLFGLLLSMLFYYTVKNISEPLLVRFALIGLLAALATLTRPVAQIYLAAILILFALQAVPARTRLAGISLACAVYLSLIIPWMFVNLQGHEMFRVSGGQGLNLFYRVVDIDGVPPITDNPTLQSSYDRRKNERGRDYFKIYFDLRNSGMSQKTIDEVMFNAAANAVRLNPRPFIEGTIRQFFQFFFAAKRSVNVCDSQHHGAYLCEAPEAMQLQPLDGFGNAPTPGHHRAKSVLRRFFGHTIVPMGALSVLALLGLGCYLGAHWREGLRSAHVVTFALFALTLLYFSLVSVTFNIPNDRYRLPVDPLLLMLAMHGAGCAISAIWDRISVRLAPVSPTKDPRS